MTTLPPPPAPPCPECVANKHGGCNGDTLHPVTDQIVDCPCFRRGHVWTPTAPPA